MKTVDEILMDHQQRMAAIHQQDRDQTFQLAQINSLAIHGHSQEAADALRAMRKSLTDKLNSQGSPS